MQFPVSLHSRGVPEDLPSSDSPTRLVTASGLPIYQRMRFLLYAPHARPSFPPVPVESSNQLMMWANMSCNVRICKRTRITSTWTQMTLNPIRAKRLQEQEMWRSKRMPLNHKMFGDSQATIVLFTPGFQIHWYLTHFLSRRFVVFHAEVFFGANDASLLEENPRQHAHCQHIKQFVSLLIGFVYFTSHAQPLNQLLRKAAPMNKIG